MQRMLKIIILIQVYFCSYTIAAYFEDMWVQDHSIHLHFSSLLHLSAHYPSYKGRHVEIPCTCAGGCG